MWWVTLLDENRFRVCYIHYWTAPSMWQKLNTLFYKLNLKYKNYTKISKNFSKKKKKIN